MASRYTVVKLSVDSIKYTKHWLDDERRCDLLVVHLHPDERPEDQAGNVIPRIKIVAVESKGDGGQEYIPPNPNRKPYKDAIKQVVATLDSLEKTLSPEHGTSLFADLQLGALFEHLTSETLSKMGSGISDPRPGDHNLAKLLTSFSKRELKLGKDIELSGMVVATWPFATVEERCEPITASGIDGNWKIALHSCGSTTLGQKLNRQFDDHGEDNAINEIPGVTGQETSKKPSSSPDVSAINVTGDTPQPSEVSERPNSDSETKIVKENQSDPTDEAVSQHLGSTGTGSLSEGTRNLIEELLDACRSRKFKVVEVEQALVREGPTLLSIPVLYEQGESAGAIQKACPDIARELGVSTISVESYPDKAYYLRFLIPRRDRTHPEIPDTKPTVFAGTENDRQYFGLSLGATIDGSPYQSFVSDWPHLLVAGTTGSGKTTLLKSLLLQLNDLPAGEVKIAIVDGKGEYDYHDLVDQSRFLEKFPKLLLGHQHAPEVLTWLVDEMDNRRDAINKYLSEHPKALKQSKQAYVNARLNEEPFPFRPIIVVIDEFADIMSASGPDARAFEDLVQRVAQRGRSALVHLILATQRPDARVLKGAIKANIPSRIALQLPSHHDSQTIINQNGAEDLVGKGDMLFIPTSGGKERLQGYLPPR